jgi:cholesterol oxidase
MTHQYDAIIVGSGFGGSVMAARLAEAGWSVCVLERGRSYPPGSFARTPHEMSRNFWDPSGGMHGLFNVWSFGNLAAVVASGLGGGSLIYANVELRKDENTFVRQDSEFWPITYTDLAEYYTLAEQMLAVQRYPIDTAPYSATPKTREFTAAAMQADIQVFQPNLAITFKAPGSDTAVPGMPFGRPSDNLHNAQRETCRLVGECDLGCNFGAKNSLDYTYLSLAQAKGAKLCTLCEVREFSQVENGWQVSYVKHDPGTTPPRDTHDPGVLPLQTVSASKLILSAGALGSTFLLLANRQRLPRLSPMIGHRYSSNGDLLTFVDGATRNVDGHEVPRILDPSVGPVITTTIRVPDTAAQGGDVHGHYIQDAGYPAFVSWLLQGSDVGTEIRQVAEFAARRIGEWLHHTSKPDIGAELSRLLRNTNRSADSMPLLGMGRDTPDGVFSLDSEGRLALDWSIDGSKSYFDQVRQTAGTLAHEMGGHLVDDPLWHFSRVVTVHSLGGCPMGDNPDRGVVDTYGRVFNCPNLLIADGSVVPGPVGPNPTLTITALAERFAEQLVADGANGSP